jgi:DNA topoisomerase-2
MSLCSTNQDIIKKYAKADMRKHVEDKSMWSGSLKPVPNKDYYISSVGSSITDISNDLSSNLSSDLVIDSASDINDLVSDLASDAGSASTKPKRVMKKKMALVCKGETTKMFTPTILKCFDEALVNAADHHTHYPDEVTEIRVTYTDTGKITVRNNGPGFEIVLHPDTNMYVPGQLVSEYLCGTNLEKDEKRIVGGSHGIGIKLANTHSDEFSIETVEKNSLRYMYFYQRFSERNTKFDEPIVVNMAKRGTAKDYSKEQKQPHTTISFQPCYAKLGHPKFNALDANDPNTKEVVACYHEVILTRTVRMAAWFADKKVHVYFNDELIPINTLTDYAKIVSTSSPVPWKFIATRSTKAKSGRSIIDTYPMNLVIGVKPFDNGFETFSIINSVITRADNCIEPIKKRIVDDVMEEVNKTKIFDEKKTGVKLQRRYINDILFLFITTHLEDPNWSSQTKESVPNMGNTLNYIIEPGVIASVATHVKAMLKEYVVPELLDNVKEKKTTAPGKVRGCKYEKAKKSTGADAAQCYLFLSEGDSAEGMIRNGMSCKGFPISKEYIGLLTLGGVIPNMRKEVSIKQTKSGPKLFRSEMIRENGFIQTFEHALGLKFGTKYDESNMNTLKYGKIVIATDQDTDGNFIKGLICNMLQITSQSLIDKLVYVLETPLIKVTKGATTVEFSTEVEFEQWCEQETGSNTTVPQGWRVEYFKGLGGHDQISAKAMFGNFVRRLIKLHTDDDTESYFECLYGTDTQRRRDELCRAVVDMQPPSAVAPVGYLTELTTNKKTKKGVAISMAGIRHRSTTNFLQYECKVHQLNNIERMLISAQDGMAETRKLILAGVIKAFRTNTKKKVCILSGEIMSSMNYTHGDASMCNGIIHMAQSFRGGRNVPLLRPLGQFGTMNKGGNDHASARYVFVKLNTKVVNALYPREDDHLLTYVYEEGEKCQPKYYLPTIAPIFESNKSPGTGWSQDIHARDIHTVILNVRRMVEADSVEVELEPMYIESYGFEGQVVLVDGIEYTVGCYDITGKDTVRITELPLKTWTAPYKESLESNDKIVEVHNFISETVDIEVKFKPGVLAKLQAGMNEDSKDPFDPIINMLNLSKSHKPILNMYDATNDKVISFKSYEEILKNWFPLRRAMYVKRIEREVIIAELKIIRIENVIRLLETYKQLKLEECNKQQLIDKLTKLKFQPVATGQLDAPGDIATEKLKSMILDSTVNTNVNFGYLCNQKIIDITAENRDEQKKKLLEMQKHLEYLKGNINAIIKETWMGEIAKVEAAVNEGRKTQWLFEDCK